MAPKRISLNNLCLEPEFCQLKTDKSFIFYNKKLEFVDLDSTKCANY